MSQDRPGTTQEGENARHHAEGLQRPVGVALERHDHKHRPYIGKADPDPCDRYLSSAPQGKCEDAAGYRRRVHLFMVWTRQGWRCLWCGRGQHEVGR